MSRIVVALGGSALGDAPQEQPDKVVEIAKAIAPLVNAGHQVILCYGDAPQVGLINLAFDLAHRNTGSPAMHMGECTAMDEGYMGFHLAQSIDNEMAKTCPQKQPTITILTQAVVDEKDPAFENPTKMIGEYYTEEQAKKYSEETGDKYVKVGDKGWRRIIASPKPVGFCEETTLKTLLNQHDMIIAAGGGGIPVARDEYGYKGIPAVIDKDVAAEKLAEMLDADMLLLLVHTDKVILDDGTPEGHEVSEITAEDAKKQMDRLKQIGMQTKVAAAVDFAESGMGRKAIIANVHHALEAADGRSGTIIKAA
ncbi:MAG: carbamate kinase [Clostridia bacterium]|nr:carbamate kinase [Clostridia bacterium]